LSKGHEEGFERRKGKGVERRMRKATGEKDRNRDWSGERERDQRLTMDPAMASSWIMY
jgi:hypothetical protein